MRRAILNKTNLTLITIATLTSCSEIGPYQGQTNNLQDMGSPTPPPQMDMTILDSTADEEGCSPQHKETICAGTCGVQLDRCGGTIECEPCPCQNGKPTQPSCGTCNLGRSSCDESNNFTCLSPLTNETEQIDCTSDITYVSSESTATTPNGSQSAPWPSFSQALAAATENEIKFIIATNSNTYDEPPLEVSSGTSIIGGYNDLWTFQPSQKTIILIQHKDKPNQTNLIGINASAITRPTLIANLAITTTDNTTAGNNIGLKASNANRLILDNVQITAGAASAGAPGESISNSARHGRKGSAGLQGQTAPDQENASYDCPFSERVHLLPEDKRKSITCEENDVQGGRGGYGGCTNTLPQAGNPSPANVGAGQAGTASSKSGVDGEHATPWTRQSWGTPGLGGQTQSRIFAGQWLPDGVGEQGGTGTHGAGGGGGGGAYKQDDPYASGPSGGNGGNGGCGGYGGHGGHPGGASIGLLIIDSFGLEIRNNSSFTSGQAGDGGQGGDGGIGGSGGEGGKGTDQACVVTTANIPGFNVRNVRDCQTLTYRSGNGGNGADGTPGGPGGGGAGGDSIGIYCHASRISLHSSTVAKAGEAGQGGLGGAYPVPDEPVMGEQGEPGLANDIIGCN